MKNNRYIYTAVLSILALSSTHAILSSSMDCSSYDVQYPLHSALRLHDTQKALHLIGTNPSLIHCSDTAGITPLHVAAFTNNYTVAATIVERGGNIHAVNCFKRTPLHDAAVAGSCGCARLLLYHGADANVQDHKGATPLFKATHFDFERIDVIQVLLFYGARPDIAKQGGFTPLHRAAFKQHVQTVDLLVTHHAPVNAQNMFGRTPLHDVLSNSSSSKYVLPIMYRLLSAGALLEIKDGEERTPLFFATQNAFDNTDAMEALLRKGANPNCSAQSITPLHVASFHAYSNAVKILCAAGANVNAQNFLGNTPLHDALTYYYSDKPYGMYAWSSPSIRELIKQHARSNIPNKRGETAQTLDRKGGWITIRSRERLPRNGYWLTQFVN